MTTATAQPSTPPTPPAVPAAGRPGGGLTGTGALTRLALRGDRIRIPAWLLALAVVVAATVSSYDKLYPTVADRVAFAASMNANAAFRALYGPVYGTADIGGIVAWLLTVAAALTAAGFAGLRRRDIG